MLLIVDAPMYQRHQMTRSNAHPKMWDLLARVKQENRATPTDFHGEVVFMVPDTKAGI